MGNEDGMIWFGLTAIFVVAMMCITAIAVQPVEMKISAKVGSLDMPFYGPTINASNLEGTIEVRAPLIIASGILNRNCN